MERSMLEVAEGLVRRRHDVTLMYQFAGDYLPLYAAFGAKTRQERAFFIDRGKTLRSAAGLAATTLHGVRAHPDLIYLNDVLHVPFGALVSKLTRAPAVSHLRLIPGPMFGRQIWMALPRIRRLIAVSSDTRARWVEYGFPADRIDVVYNAIDHERYSPGTAEDRVIARHDLGIDEAEQVVLYVGRIDKVKGIETLIDAVGRLAKKRDRVRLVVAGRPAWHETPEAGQQYVERLRRMATDVTATFLGPVVDTIRLYRAADVVAVPSEWPEPFGRVVIEAMGCARPVVATAVGGIPEILTEDLAVLLAPPADPEQLAARLDHALMAAPELGAMCRAAVMRRFDLETMLDGLEETFSRVG
jgi:glycosyltransferase involved in cell wall biosynthesis